MSVAPLKARPAAPPPPAAATSAVDPSASASDASVSAEPGAADVRRQAAGDVHSLQSVRAAAPAADLAYRGAVNEAARIYLADGPAALRVHLGADGAQLSSLANVGEARLVRDLQAALERQATGARTAITGLDASTIEGIVESVAGARIRQGIIQEAEAIVAARMRGFHQLSESLPERLETLRSAQPGTPEAVEAQLLGIRGDAGDIDRARQSIARAAQGLLTFVNRMQGQSWQPGEFPGAAGRAARRLNLEGPAESAGASAGARTHAPGESVHAVLEAAEGVHLLAEVAEVAHLARAGASVAAAGASLAVGVIGLVVGLTIHHYTEQAHQAHIDFGTSLGL